MTKTLKFMVCLDGSKYSEKALNQAILLAKNLDSKIMLIHVVEPLFVFSTIQNPSEPYWGSVSVPLIESSLNKEQKKGEKLLSKNAAILEKEGIPYETKLSLGNPSEKILDFSKKKKADFLVVGSIGKGMLSRVLLGSVSTSISQKAKCTVIIVR